MGNEATCQARLGARRAEGKALLETETLLFRSPDLRLKVPFGEISGVEASDGELRVACAEGTLVLSLGAEAERWAGKIRSPKSRLDKLGVKEGLTALLVDVADEAFREELASRARIVTRGPADLVFLGAEAARHLEKVPKLIPKMARDGALWVVRPKGSKEITERQVMEAGKGAGLVDTKVVRFSDTHTAEKFVLPVKSR